MNRLPLLALLTLAACHEKPAPAVHCDTLADAGACVAVPQLATTRTRCDGVTSHCDPGAGGAPNLACGVPVDLGMPLPDGGMPPRVTLTGLVRALESGPDTAGLTVQLIDPTLLATGANPAFVQAVGGTTTTLDGTVACKTDAQCGGASQSCLGGSCWTRVGGVEPLQRACDTDLALGCVYPLTDGCNHSCDDGLDGRKDGGKYCRDDGHGGVCRSRLRWEARYSIGHVPLDRALVLRISAPGNTTNTSWVQSLTWNVVFSSTARACTSANDNECVDMANLIYRLDVTAMAQADWTRLPQTSGLTGGIPNGTGAILGEVRDCDGVRLTNATVGVTPAAAQLTYFANDPLVFRPDVSRSVDGTDPLGRFAAWALPQGRVTLGAAGRVGGQVESLGSASVFVYAGTISFVVIQK